MKRIIFLIVAVMLLCTVSFAAGMTCPECDGTSFRTVNIPATCTENGSLTYVCKVCRTEVKVIALPAKGHTTANRVVREPTCESEGTGVTYCTVCNEDLDSNVVYPALGHDYEEVLDDFIMPTCVSVGRMTFLCQNGCGSQYYEEVPLADHMLVVKRALPTCTEDGSEITMCQVCGEEFGTVVIPATGHQYEAVPGQEDTYECTKCGHSYSDGPPEVIPPLIPDPACDHSWVCVRSAEPTAERKGFREYECSYCGVTKTEYINKLPLIPGVDYSEEEIDGSGGSVHADAEELGKAWLSGVWKLFDIYVPGFAFTFGQMYIGIALCSISVLVAKLFFGMGTGGGSSYRSGSTDNPKISKERRNDQF